PRFATVLAAVAGLVLVAAPAFAHEEINPKTFPTGQPTFFILSAANEDKADLVKLVLAAPKGTAFGEATKEPDGWSVNRTDDQLLGDHDHGGGAGGRRHQVDQRAEAGQRRARREHRGPYPGDGRPGPGGSRATGREGPGGRGQAWKGPGLVRS